MFIISLSWATYQNIQFIWMTIAVAVFFLLLKITAPYGRHSSSKWGPLISNKWGWLIMELPVLLVLFGFLYPAASFLTGIVWVMIGLFSLHYFNRVFIFPFRLRTKGKSMPLIIMLSAVFFNIVNGFSLGYFFIHFSDYGNAWFTDVRFIAGIILFFTGLSINWKADNQLIRLRKPGETDYKIPQIGRAHV